MLFRSWPCAVERTEMFKQLIVLVRGCIINLSVIDLELKTPMRDVSVEQPAESLTSRSRHMGNKIESTI